MRWQTAPLAFLERPCAIENPRIAVYYRNPARGSSVSRSGVPHPRACSHRQGWAESGASLEPDRARRAEKASDWTGVAILIEVERVEELSGKGLMSREEWRVTSGATPETTGRKAIWADYRDSRPVDPE